MIRPVKSLSLSFAVLSLSVMLSVVLITPHALVARPTAPNPTPNTTPNPIPNTTQLGEHTAREIARVAELKDPRCRALKATLDDPKSPLERSFKSHKRPAWRYRGARKRMFGDIEPLANAGRVEALYTSKKKPSRGRRAPQGFNCEHLWPRAWMGSRKGQRFKLIEADLHNLFPSEMKVNARRGHLPFGEVIEEHYPAATPSKIGRGTEGREVVEPRDERKGDVARALIYMAARWGMKWPSPHAALLTRWSELDPPDAYEKRRNELVEGLQGNRNPLVDCPSSLPRVVERLALP
jgi:deoxyribonuclease-1